MARKAVSNLGNTGFVSLMERRHYFSPFTHQTHEQTSYPPEIHCSFPTAISNNYRCNFARVHSLRTRTAAWIAKTQSSPSGQSSNRCKQHCSSSASDYWIGLATWWVADTQWARDRSALLQESANRPTECLGQFQRIRASNEGISSGVRSVLMSREAPWSRSDPWPERSGH